VKCSLVTLNVRYDNPQDGPHRWVHRRDRVVNFLQSRSPDWIALQEVLPSQRLDLDRALADYRSYGISRDGKGCDEQCCWYVREPWWIEEGLTHWLSPTPDQVSRGWDAMLPRVVSLVALRNAQARVWAGNLHLDHHGPEARLRGLELAVGLVPPGQPALLAGDFNQPDLWRQVSALADWHDAQAWADQSEHGTFHDFKGGSDGVRIDAILASPHWAVRGFELVSDSGLSDHYALWAELELL